MFVLLSLSLSRFTLVYHIKVNQGIILMLTVIHSVCSVLTAARPTPTHPSQPTVLWVSLALTLTFSTENVFVKTNDGIPMGIHFSQCVRFNSVCSQLQVRCRPSQLTGKSPLLATKH